MRSTAILLCASISSLLTAATHTVIPNRYYETFTTHEPVARIQVGDTVITRCLDTLGRDENGKLIHAGGNVLTGPFYIEGVDPGDTLVVHLDKVRLNRDWGWTNVRMTLDSLSPSSIDGIFPDKCCEDWLWPGRRNATKWTLDLKGNRLLGTQKFGDKIKMDFPAHAALGCIGVAPPTKQAISSGPMGTHGGNIDYNRMDEEAIVYLPVYERGAYFMIGDGHAGHGDGELLGNGTETSMSVQFTVDVIKGRSVHWPRVEHPESLVALGCTPGALERGFREAISEMVRWLTSDYGLSPQEAHLLVGQTAELRVASWFGTSLCKVPKSYLPPRVAK